MAIFGTALFSGILASFTQPEVVRALAGKPGQGPVLNGVEAIYKSMATGHVAHSSNDTINALFSRGGMTSMLTTVWLILGAMGFAAIMEHAGFISRLIRPMVTRARTDGRLIAATGLTCIGLNIIAGDQYIADVLPSRAYRAEYARRGLAPRMLSRTVEDMVWSRPAVTILGIDCPLVVGSAPAITPRASARLNLRVPPGTQIGPAAEALVGQLHAVAPWGVHVTAEIEAPGSPFLARTGGPAYQAIAAAMHEAYGRPMVTLGDGGSVPLCNVFADTYPDAELILMGVEEPLALIHAPNESADPAEVAAMALTEALFLQRYAVIRS